RPFAVDLSHLAMRAIGRYDDFLAMGTDFELWIDANGRPRHDMRRSRKVLQPDETHRDGVITGRKAGEKVAAFAVSDGVCAAGCDDDGRALERGARRVGHSALHRSLRPLSECASD